MKKQPKNDQITHEKDQTSSGHVKKICQNFLVHSDFGLAHRLQQEEFAVHYDRNRTQRRQTALGVKTARIFEKEEQRAAIGQKINSNQQNQKLEENDRISARRIPYEHNFIRNQRTHHTTTQSLLNSPTTEERSNTVEDTSCDEQLAKILQEEEEEQLFQLSRSRTSFH